jgi:hypothetical protein
MVNSYFNAFDPSHGNLVSKEGSKVTREEDKLSLSLNGMIGETYHIAYYIYIDFLRMEYVNLDFYRFLDIDRFLVLIPLDAWKVMRCNHHSFMFGKAVYCGTGKVVECHDEEDFARNCVVYKRSP